MKKLLCALVVAVSAAVFAVEDGKLVVGVVEACPATNKVQVSESYCKALAKCGYVPFVIPKLACENTLKAQLERCDIVLMTGGEDVEPERYGETKHENLGKMNLSRDEFEYRLLKLATDMKKPLFGICRGEQILNCFFGGTLYQDLPSEFPMKDGSACPSHRNVTHEITVLPGTRFAQVLGADRKLLVNSYHHEAVLRLAPGWRIAALSDEGVVEAIECLDYPAAGVQFHPEMIVASGSDKFDQTRIAEIFRQLPVLMGIEAPNCDASVLETMLTKTDDESLLKALIAVPSVTTDAAACNRATEMMKAHLAAHGLYCTIEEDPTGRKVLFACSRETKTPDVLISAHLDVVKPQSLSQFHATVTNGVLYGRGASDCKGHCVLTAHLLRELKDKLSIGCIFGSNEEKGGSTTRFMVEEKGYGAKKLVMCIDSEPFSVTSRQKGFSIFTVRCKAKKAVHYGLIQGVPPPSSLQRILAGIETLSKQFPGYEDGSWRDCFRVTSINTGNGVECKLTFLLVRDDWDRIESLVAEAFPDCEITNTRRSPSLWQDESDPVLVEFVRRTRAKLSDAPALDGKRHEMLGKDGSGFYHLNSTTDARWLQKFGVPIIITGTDCHGGHSASEHMILSSMQDYFELISEFLLDHYKEAK